MDSKHYKLLSITLTSLGILILLAFLPEKETLSEVPVEQALYRIVNGDKYAFMLPPYKNAEGLPLSIDEKELLNEGKLIRRYFQDEHKEIKEVRCCKMRPLDTIQEYRLTKLLYQNPLSKIKQVRIDCSYSNMTYLYNRLFPKEAIPIENSSADFYRFQEVDNRTLAISIIEQCGFPFQKETLIAAHHLILYSGNLGLAEYYYHKFEKANKKGLLDDNRLNQLKQKIAKTKIYSDKNNVNTVDNRMPDDSFFELRANTVDQVEIDEFISKMNHQKENR